MSGTTFAERMERSEVCPECRGRGSYTEWRFGFPQRYLCQYCLGTGMVTRSTYAGIVRSRRTEGAAGR